MIKLSNRLRTIANLTDDNSKIVDIGCDHGMLDIYLVQTKKNIKIIASDINKNALNNAIDNINKYQLQNKIKTILSDGLNNIDTTNLNTVIISGMGAHTIVGILRMNKDKLNTIDTLIIQSNNDHDFLRKKVVELGYYIIDEELVKEKNHIYTIIKFKKGKKHYNKKQLYFGPILLENNSKLFVEKNDLELQKLKLLLKLIPRSHVELRIKTRIKINMYKKLKNKV